MNAPTSTALMVLTQQLATEFDMGAVDPRELIDALKQTAFKGQSGNPPSDAQMVALLMVAKQYRLNPWLKEIHAFPAKGGGIVPIVGVDGWSNIINSHPQMDGMEFETNWEPGNESITCSIWRKDRNRPVRVTEYLAECKRSTEPWQMARRMLRHKSMIQCGRVAFSYGGIYDPDEAERIIENGDAGAAPIVKHMGAAEVVQPSQSAQDTRPAFPQDEFDKGLPVWRKAAARLPVAEVLARAEAANPDFAFTEQQKAAILSIKKDAPPAATFASVADAITKAKDADALATARDLIRQVAEDQQRKELEALADERETSLTVEG
jgi:phage recombination protein Bet